VCARVSSAMELCALIRAATLMIAVALARLALFIDIRMFVVGAGGIPSGHPSVGETIIFVSCTMLPLNLSRAVGGVTPTAVSNV
jgi:hypothetical protein